MKRLFVSRKSGCFQARWSLTVSFRCCGNDSRILILQTGEKEWRHVPPFPCLDMLNKYTNPAPYLTKVLNKKYRNSISKLRLSSHPLLIETERYTGIPRAERRCVYYDTQDIEDEYHFVIKCEKYNVLRNTYIPRYFITNSSVHKFIELLNSNNTRMLNNLAIYTIKALKLRLETVNEVI